MRVFQWIVDNNSGGGGLASNLGSLVLLTGWGELGDTPHRDGAGATEVKIIIICFFAMMIWEIDMEILTTYLK